VLTSFALGIKSGWLKIPASQTDLTSFVFWHESFHFLVPICSQHFIRATGRPVWKVGVYLRQNGKNFMEIVCNQFHAAARNLGSTR
jgi:hypothetical protein